MKSDSSGDIKVQICVVHTMDSPEDRDSMEYYVLQVDDKVHNNYR